MSEAARFAVVGAGAIGATIAWFLADAGHDVVAAAPRRPEDDVVVLERDGLAEARPVRWATDPAEVGEPVDWVVVAAKLHQTASTAPWFVPLVGPGTRIVAAQNGVDQRERLAACTSAPVAPALVYYNAERVAPGRVRLRPTERDLVLPDTPEGRDAAAVLDAAGIRSVVADDFRTAAWRKLLTNVAANPITALTGRRVEVLREPGAAALALEVLGEAVAVGRAEGAALDDSDAAERLAWLQALQPGSTTSMLQDRLAGRPMEHDGITGVVVRLGERHGIPTPANRALLALLDAAR